MAGLDLLEGQKIIIENQEYIVSGIVKREINEDVSYYTYELSTNDSNVTHVAIDYISDNNLIFHLTKKVISEISGNFVKIDEKEYSITSVTNEIYMDAINGDLKDAKLYYVKSNKTGPTPSELHIHGDNNQIFYLTLNLKKDEVIIQ